MIFSKKEFTFSVYLLIYVNVINIAFTLMQWYGVILIRPYIVYEYLLIALLIGAGAPTWTVWLYFVVVLVVDLLMQVSFIFLFSLGEFIGTLKFYSLYNFSALQYLGIVAFALFLFLNYVLIKMMRHARNRSPRAIFVSTLTFFIFLLTVDVLNGNHILNEAKVFRLSNGNIAGAILKVLWPGDLTKKPVGPHPIDPSLTMRTFGRDSSGSQLLIVVESWGLLVDQEERSKFEMMIKTKGDSNGWQVEMGETGFKGSTTSAELKELISVAGSYEYFLNPDSAKLLPSIFNLKKKQGYYSVGAHSFSGKMFKRLYWWKNIGMDSVYFMDDILEKRHGDKSLLNNSTPFTAVDDEAAFSVVNTAPPRGFKKFGYVLTENSHLPYTQMSPQKNIQGIIDYSGSISFGANQQMRRVEELLFHFIHNADKNVWSKILILGDHMPPHSKESDRKFYSAVEVPYIILSR